MSDWLAGSDPVGGSDRAAPGRAPVPDGRNAAGGPWLLVAAEALLLVVGLVALVALPGGLKIVGYLACGLALPLLWALLYVNLKRRDLIDDARTVWLEKLNRWLLVSGFAIGIWCAIQVATEWAK